MTDQDIKELSHIAQVFWLDIFKNPEKFTALQTDYWQKATQAVIEKKSDYSDKRFHQNSWEDNPAFDYLKNWYLFHVDYCQKLLFTSEYTRNLDPKFLKKLNFFVQQWLNTVSPTNSSLTNPDILKITAETKGQNLQQGFQYFLEDLATGKIRTNDTQAFSVGKNLAITPGKVIYQTDLMQLIQYLPATETVYKTPLLMIPPWINKYYILDLQAHNSLVKFMRDQGFTVYMISWVNPDKRFAHKSFDDYMIEGSLAALKIIQQKTGNDRIHTLGFCIGGTLLACTLAYWQKTENQSVQSATYLATLLDFADSGDLGVFIDEAQICALEKIMEKSGYLNSQYMSTVFSLLRSNDLIWHYFIHRYLKGKTSKAFDILYWNADGTNMPLTMHSQYLRNMYLHNLLAKPNAVKLNHVGIDLSQIRVPTYCVAPEKDHIAPLQAVKTSMNLLVNSTVRFVTTESGHIAGIINPPSAKKYGYYIDNHYYQDSWWNDWSQWLAQLNNEKIDSKTRIPAEKEILEDAPGSYVLQLS